MSQLESPPEVDGAPAGERGVELRSALHCVASVRRIEVRTPLEVLERLRPLGFPWMLETASLRPGAGDATFIGADPIAILRARRSRQWLESPRGSFPAWIETLAAREDRGAEASAFDTVRRLTPPPPAELDLAGGIDATELPGFLGGWVGFLSYELSRSTEPVELRARDDLELPDLALLLVDRLIAFDAERGICTAVGLGIADARDRDGALDAAVAAREAIVWAVESAPAPANPRPAVDRASAREVRRESLSQAAHSDAVAEIRSEIEAGEVYQANLTMRFSRPFSGDPLALYTKLRRSNPSPFAAYLELPELALVGSSPERFLCVDADGRVRSEPIKGTRPRGATPALDQALAEELGGSEKDRAENLMIVDLVRNDLGRVCRIGSVEVPSLMRLESYATVHQLVSTVEGELDHGRDAIDAIRATFPPGSMTGAPKIAALRLIDRLEPVCRGVYSGAVGYLDLRGNADWAVVIRSIVVKDGWAHLGVGGGIVHDSLPGEEYQEALDKARALERALDEACEGPGDASE